MLSDEEKKKREEEAKNIISSMTSSKEAISSINYNNYNIKTNNDSEKEYIKRVKEANSIINSINPRENVSAPSIDENEKITSQKNAKNFINLISGNIQEDNETEKTTTSNTKNPGQQEETTDNSAKSEAVNVILNGNKLTGTMTEEEKAEQEGIKQQNLINTRESNSDKKLLSQLGKSIENLWLGAVSGVKSLANYVINTEPLNNDQKAQQQTGLSGNNNIPTIVKEEYKNNTDTLNVLNNIPKEKLYLASEEIKKQQNDKNIPISKQTKQNIDSQLSKYTDAYGDLELNPGRRVLSESISKNQNKIATNVNKISNPVLKKVSELAPSTGNSLLGAGISIVNPYLGMSYFMVSASGSYEADGRNRGMTKEEARDYGMIMGWAEGASEMIEIDKFLKAGSSLREGAFKEALKNYGLDMADNAIQEAVIDPVDELAAQLTSGKTKNDYSDGEGYKQLVTDMIQDGIDGALSSLLMNGLTVGIDSSIYLYNKIQNNENITQQDIQNAYKDIQNNTDINIEKEFKDSFQYQKDKLLNNSDNVYNVLETDNEGTVTGLKQVLGEQIELNNDKLNITPVVVYNNGYYNIIDGETGVNLDTSMYNNKQEAIECFNNKIINADNATIKNVNNQVTKSKLALINKIQDVQEKVTQNPEVVQKQSKINFVEDNKLYSTDETKNILNNYSIDTSVSNRPYIGQEINDIINNKLSQTAEDKKLSTFHSSEANYAVQDIKKVTESFGEKKSYTKSELANIWNNNISDNEYDVVYDSNGDIQSYIAIEEDGKNLVVNQYDNEDNIVKSEIIPVNNGKYTAEDVRNTIGKVASIYDENKLIKGQVDVEGNEVRNIEKKQQKNNNSSHVRTFESEIDKYKKESKEKDIIKNNIVEINTNIFNGISKNKQSSFMNEYLRYELQGIDFYKDSEKIIATSKTTGKLKNGKTNFDKRIDKTFRNELKSNIIANIDKILKVSQITQANRIDTKNHSFADTFDRRKALIKYKGQQFEVMFETGKKDNISTLYGIENIKITKKISLSSPKLTTQSGLQNTKNGMRVY